MGRWLLRLALVVMFACLAGLAWCFTHRTFLGRLVTFPHDAPITSVSWYEPLETVRGNPAAPIPMAAAGEGGRIARAALDQAVAWAGKRNTVALLVVRDGAVELERYFHGWSADQPTNSYSMAKTLLGMLVGIAIERGAIGSLDDSIADYLPEWRHDQRASITIRDLLAMQSGLLYDNDRQDPFSDMVQTHLSDDLVPTILDLRPGRPPGRDFEYNNLNSQVLGIALERATQQRYADFLSTQLWSRIGAGDAAVWLDRAGGTAKTYCCMFATARDWARVGALVLADGVVDGQQVVPRAWLERMLEPSTFEPGYGLHIWLNPGDVAAGVPRFIKLDGGKKQRVYVLPEERVVIVRLGEQARYWDDTFLPRIIASGIETR